MRESTERAEHGPLLRLPVPAAADRPLEPDAQHHPRERGRALVPGGPPDARPVYHRPGRLRPGGGRRPGGRAGPLPRRHGGDHGGRAHPRQAPQPGHPGGDARGGGAGSGAPAGDGPGGPARDLPAPDRSGPGAPRRRPAAPLGQGGGQAGRLPQVRRGAGGGEPGVRRRPAPAGGAPPRLSLARGALLPGALRPQLRAHAGRADRRQPARPGSDGALPPRPGPSPSAPWTKRGPALAAGASSPTAQLGQGRALTVGGET